MWMDAESDDEEVDGDGEASDEDAWDLTDDGAYWRRRFFMLCAGVVALGVCAWLFPGARQAPGTSAAARESMAAAATRQPLPPAAYGPAWPGAAPAASPSASPSGSAKLAGKRKKLQQVSTVYRPRSAGSPAASPGSAHGGKAAAVCAPADIVLSLFTSQASYDRKARPRFDVYAVSTAAAGCTLTFGPGAVRVIVTSRGHVVWNSAACHPPAARPVRFTLGVPRLLTVTWNRGAARPAGCAGSLPAGFTGSLRAVAVSHGQSSPARAFRLVK
jgi:hypothetical protein